MTVSLFRVLATVCNPVLRWNKRTLLVDVILCKIKNYRIFTVVYVLIGRETHNLLEVVNYILDNRTSFLVACEKMASVSNYDDGRLLVLKL